MNALNMAKDSQGSRPALEFRGLFVVGVGLITVLVIAASTSLLEPAPIIRIWTFALLPVVTLALFRAARRHRDSELGVFYLRVGIAYLAWVAAGVLQPSLEGLLTAGVATLVRDILYGLYYSAFLWAIEWAPTGIQRSRGERIVSLTGSLMLVGGCLVYLQIPSPVASAGDRVSHLVLYTVLDVYFAARLARLAYGAGCPPLRAIFGLFGLTGLAVGLAEAVETATLMGTLDLATSSPATLLWVLPSLPLLLAAHVSGFEVEEADRGSRSHRPLGPSLWSPLIAYGFVLPVAHVVLYATGLGFEASERVRGLFVLGWLLALAALIVTQRWVLARRVLAAERALRESYERIRSLTRAREEAGESERRHLGRELHDELGQLLVALRIELAWLTEKSGADDPIRERHLESATSLVRQAFESIRRIASELHPRILDDLGLEAALEELVVETAKQGGMQVRLIADSTLPRLGTETETALYRVAQESLANCLEHARAEAIEVRLTREEGVELEIRDDGIGLRSSRHAVGSGFGLLGIHERAHSLGARVTLGAGIEGRGLSIRISLAEAQAVDPLASGERGVASRVEA